MSKVLDSDNPNFRRGDLVSGFTGWEEYSLINRTEQMRKIEQNDIPLSYYVGLLGKKILPLNFFYLSHFTNSCVFYLSRSENNTTLRETFSWYIL